MRNNFLIFILVLAVAFVGFSLYKILIKKAKINEEISGLQLNVEELKELNNELSDALEYLKTDSYLEKEAKENLNLQKPGEKVIMVNRKHSSVSEKKETQDGSLMAIQEKSHSNWMAWWNYFFSAND